MVEKEAAQRDMQGDTQASSGHSGLASKAESTALVSNEKGASAKSEAEDQAVPHVPGLSEDGKENEDEEDEECAFCRFMKGGGCKEQFIAWEECVADAKESGDFVSKCADITEALQLCMNAPENKDYYQLFLDDQEEYVQEHKQKGSEDTMPTEPQGGQAEE